MNTPAKKSKRSDSLVAPAPAAGDGQGAATVKKLYAVFSVGPMRDRTLLGVYPAATPLDACHLAQPCCYDFDPPWVDEYDGVKVYEVPASGSVALSRYVAGFVMRRVDWPGSRSTACQQCREWFK